MASLKPWRLVFQLALGLLTVDRGSGSSVPSLNRCGHICGNVPPPLGRTKRDAGELEPTLYSYEEDAGIPRDYVPPEDYDPYYGDLRESLGDGEVISNVSDWDTRIMNGYDAEDRPWLALLSIAGASCGGALLNKRYVLTAAHCFCRQSGVTTCEEVITDGLRTHQPRYNLPKTAIVFLGLNGSPLRTKGRNQDQIYRVISVLVRAGWFFGKTFSPDLALAKLNRDVEFSPELAPICIPPVGPFPDISTPIRQLHAYVAGWGAAYSQCDTDTHGPSPHTMCKFPFVYKGVVHHQCAQSPPPSQDNPVCGEFKKWHASQPTGTEAIPGSYAVFYWDERLNQAARTTCYQPGAAASQYGWCGTCYPGNLSPGDEGYCDKFLSGSETKVSPEFGRPKVDSHWGWCNSWCANTQGQTNSQRLQETVLDILTPEQCQQFGASLDVNATTELCTGLKQPFEYVYQFRRVQEAGGGSMKFVEEAKFQNRLGIANTEMDFYLGGTDSCQGDSGGPLIRWVKVNGPTMRAYLIGTVSRGIGCGNFNQPGIFTRTTSHLAWIYDNIQDGNC